MSRLTDIAAALEALKSKLAGRGIATDLGDVNWTYDSVGRHVEAIERAGAVVMGFNAGAGRTGSEARWRNKCEKLTRGVSGGFMLAELVLISSYNIGELNRAHPDVGDLIKLCSTVNNAVLAYHQPEIVLQTGFGYSDAVVTSYKLTLRRVKDRPDHATHVLLKHYEMPDGKPWLAIRHPSSFGFSNHDVEAVRSYVSEECGVEISD